MPFARRSRGAVRASGAARDDDDDVPTSSESTDDGARLERWRARARAMRVKTLKERLSSMNLRHDDCLEKSELVDRAARAWLTRARTERASSPSAVGERGRNVAEIGLRRGDARCGG